MYLYSGEQNDPNLGFYYLRARYFNAGSGRFVTADSSLGKTFDPRTLHRYTYAANNPVNLMDPNGRQFTLPELLLSVTILEILSIQSFDIALSANTVLIIENLDRPGFLAQNAAIQLIAGTDDPAIIGAAQDLYAKGGRLITIASADVKAAAAITDLANAAFSLGGIMAGALTAAPTAGRVVNPVLIGLAASELLVKAHAELSADNDLYSGPQISDQAIS